jgi:hypothetical protein
MMPLSACIVGVSLLPAGVMYVVTAGIFPEQIGGWPHHPAKGQSI